MEEIVLVYDVPESCFRCKYDRYDHLCGISLKNNDGNANKRPSWCPLRPLPEKKDLGYPNDDYDIGFTDGWDACIDEILGETE